jgi:hypothetical protein
MPVRTATQTWTALCDLLAPSGTTARNELDAITGVAALIITEEYSSDAAIVVSGAGPQVRIYTLHGDKALDAEGEPVLPLQTKLPESGWTLSLPARGDDVAAVSSGLTGRSGRVLVRDTAEAQHESTPPATTQGEETVSHIDISTLMKP